MKTRNYFIIGLPRSGTAWTANFLTWGNSYCHHEGIYECDGFDSFSDILNVAEYAGDSGTALVMVLPWLYERFSDAKFVFIKRDVARIKDSLQRLNMSTTCIKEGARALQWGIDNIPSMVIEFDDLFADTQKVWEYIGLKDFPVRRHTMLKNMKVDNADKFSDAAPMNYTQYMGSAA